MKGKAGIIIVVLATLLIVGLALILKIFIDPYYHREYVNLATWIYRELDEVVRGERSQGRY